MKAATAKLSPRRSLETRRKTVRPTNEAPKLWTPPDFAKRRREDFADRIMPFSYVDFIER